MTVRRTSPITIYVEHTTKDFLAKQAAQKHLTLSAYCMMMVGRGLAMDEIEQATEAMREIVKSDFHETILREVLATRYIVASHACGQIKNTATLGFDANTYAQRELEKVLSKGKGT